MTPNRDLHFCKHCRSDFIVRLHEAESGDLFLVCPGCGWRHYRHFVNGEAVHCELAHRKAEPVEIKGTRP